MPAAEAKKPNIVWIVVDDMSRQLRLLRREADPDAERRCNGEGGHALQPRLRHRAGLLAVALGADHRVYQTTIGAHHHRSGRGTQKIHLPDGVVPVPKLFQKAGYYTCIGGFNAKGKNLGKTDYNFEWDACHVRRQRLVGPQARPAVLHAGAAARRQVPRPGAGPRLDEPGEEGTGRSDRPEEGDPAALLSARSGAARGLGAATSTAAA